MKHRKPPLPASMTAKRIPGFCRWCGLEIIERGKRNIRKTWHPECVKVYFITKFSKDQRAALWKRDKGICVSCGLDTCVHLKESVQRERGYMTGKYWQADHKIALVNASRDLRMWSMDNLQTLCTECHKKKTQNDIQERDGK